MIAPPLWNACDYVLQLDFTIAHIPGKMNTAADFLSRLEMNPNWKIRLKVRDVNPSKPIALNIDYTGKAQEEPVFLNTTDQHETTAKKTGIVKQKHEMQYQLSHQSSHCRGITQMTYTKTKQLWTWHS